MSTLGQFFVGVQQSIVAVGTFCELDDLTIAGEEAKDKLAELLVESIDIHRSAKRLISAAHKVISAYGSEQDIGGHINDLQSAVYELEGVE